MSLFQQPSTSGPAAELRAGKCAYSGTRVTPEDRKGLLFIKENEDLPVLCWKDRATGEVEDELIMFPGDAKLVPVTQPKDGKVYVLKFTSSAQRHFFWSQGNTRFMMLIL